jgi:hypothetical protein
MPLKLCPKKQTNSNAKQAGDDYLLVVPAPQYEGPYRLMVSVVDKQNKAATGNAVFYVYN